jgi:hypothetical protein
VVLHNQHGTVRRRSSLIGGRSQPPISVNRARTPTVPDVGKGV